MNKTYKIVEEHRYRKLIRDALWLGRKKKYIVEYIEIDVTNVRNNIREYRRNNKSTLSLNAYFVKAIADSIKKFPLLNSTSYLRNRTAIFNDVDVLYPTELEENGEAVIAATILRKADTKPLVEIHNRLESLKKGSAKVFSKEEEFFISLPQFVRRLFYRLISLSPKLYQQIFGSVMISSFGIYASENIWGAGVPFHTLAIYIGPVISKFVLPNNEERKLATFSFCFDHELVDGNVGTRFIQHLYDEIKKGEIE